ncbi:MAG: hypothetical protein N4A36_02065, partial [Candidatus Gracilibacteria bacterium]|nr:hypothetical protein [Candidatus Gracilibacteria bacterium]
MNKTKIKMKKQKLYLEKRMCFMSDAEASTGFDLQSELQDFQKEAENLNGLQKPDVTDENALKALKDLPKSGKEIAEKLESSETKPQDKKELRDALNSGADFNGKNFSNARKFKRYIDAESKKGTIFGSDLYAAKDVLKTLKFKDKAREYIKDREDVIKDTKDRLFKLAEDIKSPEAKLNSDFQTRINNASGDMLDNADFGKLNGVKNLEKALNSMQLSVDITEFIKFSIDGLFNKAKSEISIEDVVEALERFAGDQVLNHLKTDMYDRSNTTIEYDDKFKEGVKALQEAFSTLSFSTNSNEQDPVFAVKPEELTISVNSDDRLQKAMLQVADLDGDLNVEAIDGDEINIKDIKAGKQEAATNKILGNARIDEIGIYREIQEAILDPETGEASQERASIMLQALENTGKTYATGIDTRIQQSQEVIKALEARLENIKNPTITKPEIEAGTGNAAEVVVQKEPLTENQLKAQIDYYEEQVKNLQDLQKDIQESLEKSKTIAIGPQAEAAFNPNAVKNPDVRIAELKTDTTEGVGT